MSSWQTVLAWPDTHIPDHDPRAVAGILQLVHEYDPDRIVILGDFVDMRGPARWSRGMAEEYQSDLQMDCNAAVGILESLRAVWDGPCDYIEGNHEARIRAYLARYAPALRDLQSLQLPELLEFDRLAITYQGQPLTLAPGWVAIHGDKLAGYAGGSALRMAREFGESVVQGHSHRLGLIHETRGHRERRKTIAAVECGHLADIDAASYLTHGSANWQQGFALLHISDAGTVIPELVHIQSDGSFLVHGQEYPIPSFDDFDDLERIAVDQP